jgi:hypothetical protein
MKFPKRIGQPTSTELYNEFGLEYLQLSRDRWVQLTYMFGAFMVCMCGVVFFEGVELSVADKTMTSLISIISLSTFSSLWIGFTLAIVIVFGYRVSTLDKKLRTIKRAKLEN